MSFNVEMKKINLFENVFYGYDWYDRKQRSL